MKSLSRLILCVLGAAFLIGCNDPYRPAANPDAAEEQQMKEKQQKAEADRRQVEQEQAQVQWKRDGGSDE